MNDLDSPYLNTPSQERSAKAVDVIMQAARDLIEADSSKSPTSRELVEKSGYSMGTIYRYFEKIDDLFVYLFLARHQSEVERVIGELKKQSPESDIHAFIQIFIKASLANWSGGGQPRKRNRFVVRQYLKRAQAPERINTLTDAFIPVFLEIQRKDLSNTLRVMDHEECRLALRAGLAILRSPYIEDSAIAGSETHYRYAQEMLYRLFGKNAP